MLRSSACTLKQLQSETFREWAAAMKVTPGAPHRKLWEFCYIAQALQERGMLQPGKRGIGFAVGQEPLAALFAAHGCEVVAPALDAASAGKGGWVATNQHAASIDALNQLGLCPADEFRQRASFRVVDMNRIPSDLRGFDFAWSSCSIEHLGSLAHGLRFMLEMTRCLKPGGVAVHTTEYNVFSDTATLRKGHDVIFRRCDLLYLGSLLQSCGHRLAPLDFFTGTDHEDLVVDEPPYDQLPHLKLRQGPFAATSFGLIVTAGKEASWYRRTLARLRTRLWSPAGSAAA